MNGPSLFGIDVLPVFFRGLHAMMAAAWLLFDFIVYWLHFDIKNPAVPLERRLERARVMHGIDGVVGYLFILMFPVGLLLCFFTDTPLFTTPWLNWKHALYALVIIAALVLIPISGTALRNLEAMRDGAANTKELNDQIRRHMNVAMPVVFAVWILIIAISVLSLLNLKTPPGQEYIFRKTAAEIGAARSEKP
jgi:hypothetical protein